MGMGARLGHNAHAWQHGIHDLFWNRLLWWGILCLAALLLLLGQASF